MIVTALRFARSSFDSAQDDISFDSAQDDVSFDSAQPFETLRFDKLSFAPQDDAKRWTFSAPVRVTRTEWGRDCRRFSAVPCRGGFRRPMCC
jgi:hypothetical protein